MDINTLKSIQVTSRKDYRGIIKDSHKKEYETHFHIKYSLFWNRHVYVEMNTHRHYIIIGCQHITKINLSTYFTS